jgi:hypothetical protein
MTGAMIAELIIRLGPGGLDLIEKLASIWTKELTPAELIELVQSHRKTAQQYRDAEAAARVKP